MCQVLEKGESQRGRLNNAGCGILSSAEGIAHYLPSYLNTAVLHTERMSLLKHFGAKKWVELEEIAFTATAVGMIMTVLMIRLAHRQANGGSEVGWMEDSVEVRVQGREGSNEVENSKGSNRREKEIEIQPAKRGREREIQANVLLMFHQLSF
ncbi:hypothetical protein INR49_024997 [Caranx melampygus]|nr:hypothetical protein INR49_024997 [Caranx melampygus]